MTTTTVAVVTPPGSSAVAVLTVRGPSAWQTLQRLFRTAAVRALATPPAGFVFGHLGDSAADEVILAAVGPESFEVHCHGGPRVVAWLLDQFRGHGIDRAPAPGPGPPWADEAARLLPLARTTRTAGILLDQAHGAYDRAEAAASADGPDVAAIRATLRRNAAVGRHLVAPWTVAIVGPPNAGKSSLCNALAGFARSVVSPMAGTTRDVVSVTLAFDGWPVELTDTAGLRPAADVLEEEGVGRARAVATGSDLVLWVVDATGPREFAPDVGVPANQLLIVLNKIDLADVPDAELPSAARVSAATGVGLAHLVNRIVATLVPDPPEPGEPVPFTPDLCDRWS